MNKKPFVLSRLIAASFFATVFGVLPASVEASPSSEISRAVIIAGAPSVKQADAPTFIKGFSSVIVRPDCQSIAGYVTAAVKLRPDLVSQITVAAIKAHHRDVSDTSCDCVDPIIRAAIAAAPDAKKLLLQAALDAAPWARECILAAGGETQTAFFRPPGVDAGNVNNAAIGTLNPANVGGSAGQGNVNTPENDATTICHNGQTIVVSRAGAEAHIRNHPSDHLGPCAP